MATYTSRVFEWVFECRLAEETEEFKAFEAVAGRLRDDEPPSAEELEAAAMRIGRCGGFLCLGLDGAGAPV